VRLKKKKRVEKVVALAEEGVEKMVSFFLSSLYLSLLLRVRAWSF
jgi:hypothetical protein